MPKGTTIIDETDRKLIILLNKNSRVSASSAAKMLRKSREFIDYRIRKLVRLGYFSSFTITVSNKMLGFEAYQILLRLNNYTYEQQSALLSYLSASSNVKILERCSGDWDVLAKVVFTDRYYLVNFLDRLNEKFSAIINNYEILMDHIPVKHEDLFFISPFRFLASFRKHSSERYIRDEVDKRMLAILAEDSRISLKSLAMKAGISIDSGISRFKKLVGKNVITSFKSLINFEKFDVQFYYLFLRISKFSEEKRKKLEILFENEHGVVYAGRVIGNWDLLIQVVARNQKEFDVQMERIRTHLTNEIKSYAFAMVIENISKVTYPKIMH